LFPSREVTTLGSLVVVDQLGIGLLGPALRGSVDFVWESRHGNWDLDATHVEEAGTARMVGVVPVESRRRDRRVGEPIQRYVVEHVVGRQALRRSGKGACDHLLAAVVMVDHP